jgi:AcrR family transcriptional regulator
MLIKMPRQPIQNQRALQRDNTRRQLVSAGLKVVAENGFAGASTAAIAHASGMAHGTVFVHFRTRDALVAELVAEIGRAMSERLAELETEDPSLADVLTAHLTALADKEVLYSRLLTEAAILPQVARAHVFALQNGIAFRIRAAYMHALAQGTVREINSVMFSNIWISLTNHYLMNRELFAPEASVIAKYGDEIKAQLLELVRP